MRLKMKGRLFILILLASFSMHARIKLVEFVNESNIEFNQEFLDGKPFQTVLNAGDCIVLDSVDAIIQSVDGRTAITFEDAGKSGFHRPHWKYHVWIKSDSFPFLNQEKLLYAVIFYDGDGEVKIHINPQGKIAVIGGYDVKDVLYPWSIGTIGRGNPYHQIKGKEFDQNGIVFFDQDGFVGYPFSPFREG